MIALINKQLLAGIFSEVKKLSCFTVIVDKTADKLVKSQLSVVVIWEISKAILRQNGCSRKTVVYFSALIL